MLWYSERTFRDRLTEVTLPSLIPLGSWHHRFAPPESGMLVVYGRLSTSCTTK